jgi:hypothetical protein
VAAGHIPYLSFRQFEGFDTNTGQRVVQQVIDRIYVNQLSGFAYRPFSQTRRFEMSAGFTRLSYDREIRDFLVDPAGRIIDERRFDDDEFLPDPLNLIESSVAIVGDNSNFGFTSPVVGQRYRAEVAPTFGSLQFQTALLDYRRYFFMQPISFAFRAMHYGRYGKDSDNADQLRPLFLGYETFVRGYAYESFDINECSGTTPENSCPEFDRLIGSKMAVANLELRIPLFGVPGLGLINMPFLPTEIAPFIDAGVAWWGNEVVEGETTDGRPKLTFDRNTSERVPVVSAGVSARFNILGYLILEAYYAYPFQRPAKGGHFGFQIAPGW